MALKEAKQELTTDLTENSAETETPMICCP